MWFNVKCEDSIMYGSKHLFSLVNSCKSLDEDTKDILLPVIQRNSYFGHSENILLAMLVDENPRIRLLAFCRILRARKSMYSNMRCFRIPKIIFEAKSYYDLIEWKTDYIGTIN